MSRTSFQHATIYRNIPDSWGVADDDECNDDGLEDACDPHEESWDASSSEASLLSAEVIQRLILSRPPFSVTSGVSPLMAFNRPVEPAMMVIDRGTWLSVLARLSHLESAVGAPLGGGFTAAIDQPALSRLELLLSAVESLAKNVFGNATCAIVNNEDTQEGRSIEVNVTLESLDRITELKNSWYRRIVSELIDLHPGDISLTVEIK